jgi:hypothetical protein
VGDITGSAATRNTAVGGNEAVADASVTLSISGTKVKTEINRSREAVLEIA